MFALYKIPLHAYTSVYTTNLMLFSMFWSLGATTQWWLSLHLSLNSSLLVPRREDYLLEADMGFPLRLEQNPPLCPCRVPGLGSDPAGSPQCWRPSPPAAPLYFFLSQLSVFFQSFSA